MSPFFDDNGPNDRDFRSRFQIRDNDSSDRSRGCAGHVRAPVGNAYGGGYVRLDSCGEWRHGTECVISFEEVVVSEEFAQVIAAEARDYDREASELEAVVRRLEEMSAILSSFEIRPPDEEGDVWFYIRDQGRPAGRLQPRKPVNLSQPEGSYSRIKISHHVAALLETARQSAIGDRP